MNTRYHHELSPFRRSPYLLRVQIESELCLTNNWHSRLREYMCWMVVHYENHTTQNHLWQKISFLKKNVGNTCTCRWFHEVEHWWKLYRVCNIFLYELIVFWRGDGSNNRSNLFIVNWKANFSYHIMTNRDHW